MKSKNKIYLSVFLALVVFFALFQYLYFKNQKQVEVSTPPIDSLTEGNFGNDQIEKAITDYLLTQERFSWKNREDSHTLCAIANLSPENELFPLYVWAYCGEYIMENGELKSVSGSSGPVKIDYPNELSFYRSDKFSYEAPGDGSQYSEDVRRIFPESVQQRIFDFKSSALILKIETAALANIQLWESIKQGAAECEIKSVMQTHSLQVTATFKDGREITAREPRIDDIFDVLNQYEDTCGKVIMATE